MPVKHHQKRFSVGPNSKEAYRNYSHNYSETFGEKTPICGFCDDRGTVTDWFEDVDEFGDRFLNCRELTCPHCSKEL